MKAQSEFTLYRNAQYPLDGTPNGAWWEYPGVALSANTVQFYPGMTLLHARWVVAWNPNTGASPTGIRLVHADSGPANEAEIARFLARGAHSPRVDAVDVTAALKSLGRQKTLAHQTAGNGTNGCKIYGSWIEVVWD